MVFAESKYKPKSKSNWKTPVSGFQILAEQTGSFREEIQNSKEEISKINAD